MLITLIKSENQEMEKERAEKKKKTSNTPQQKVTVTGKPKADYQISKLPMSVSVNYTRILIGQKQLQIFRQKTVGSDILLYRPAPSYE
jgi:hypothetical protein